MFSVGSRLRSTPARSMIQSRELPRIVASGGREVSSRRRRVAQAHPTLDCKVAKQ